MNVYHYDRGTREYTGMTVARRDPQDPDSWLVPAFATADAPPDLPGKFAAVRNADNSGWELVADYRGTAWKTDTREPVTITALGPLPDGVTDQQPAPFDIWVDDGWVINAEAETAAARHATAQAVRTGFEAAIELPVPALATTWNGGMYSALAIDGAVRLAEQMGMTAVTLFDADNADHIVSIDEGRTVAAAVAADYQTKLARKQQLLRDIAAADAEQLTTLVWVD